MKLVLLMYLEEDDDCVTRLLADHGVESYSRLEIEGRGPGGTAGWYGETPSYESRMIMTIVGDEMASSLLRSVQDCTGVQDPRHPVRAALLDVEQFVSCHTT